jgi:DNA-binding NarL/FixJ family response regulator
METNNPMRIVLIEDEARECRDFMDYANTRPNDIVFVGMTGISNEGMQLVKHKMPEAIIVDLELNKGEGSGYDFLDEFYNTEFIARPICVITTRNRNKDVHSYLHDKYGISTLFYKNQRNYGPEMVIRHLLRFREMYYSQESGRVESDFKSSEAPEDLEKRIKGRIKAELNAIQMSTKYKGRRAAEEAIYTLLSKDYGDDERIFNELAKKHNMHYNNFTRNIQNAINKVWNNPGNVDMLLKHYTAPVSGDNGSPTPTEFIHYYADLIRPDI